MGSGIEFPNRFNAWTLAAILVPADLQKKCTFSIQLVTDV